MSDKIKGFLVTFEKDISEENFEQVKNAVAHIRNVQSVKPYITKIEDYMLYERAQSELGNKLLAFVRKECFGIKDGDKQR
jgi:hypothetical protein